MTGGFYRRDNRWITDGHCGYLIGPPDAVLQVIEKHANELGMCHLKTTTIARLLDCDIKTVKRALNILRNPARCYVKSRRSRDCLYFEIQPLPSKSTHTPKNRASTPPDSPPSGPSENKNPTNATIDAPDSPHTGPSEAIPDSPPSGPSSRTTKRALHEKKNPRRSTPPTPDEKNRGNGDGGYSEEFDRFWGAYPRRRRGTKSEAFKSYLRAQKRSGDERLPSIDELMPILEKHKAQHDWTKKNGEYVPAPTTWLNNSRWTAEIMEGSSAESDERWSPEAQRQREDAEALASVNRLKRL